MEKMYHVGFDDTHGAKYVILPGDPGRVEKIAQFLDEPHFYCQHREYTTWLGKVDGETVMVMSTGMGGPSTAIGMLQDRCSHLYPYRHHRRHQSQGHGRRSGHRQQRHPHGGHHP